MRANKFSYVLMEERDLRKAEELMNALGGQGYKMKLFYKEKGDREVPVIYNVVMERWE